MTDIPPDATGSSEPVPWSQQAAEESLPWARRPMTQAERPVTQRARRLAAGLPQWDPMPPGEILVVRPDRA